MPVQPLDFRAAGRFWEISDPALGGLVSPLIGGVADAISLQVALAPLILMPALSWLLVRTLAEPAAPRR